MLSMLACSEGARAGEQEVGTYGMVVNSPSITDN